MQKQNLIIIDAFGLLFRAYYALSQLRTSDGIFIGGVHGFINMLLKYINKNNYLVIVYDNGQKNFRHEMYQEYKINRSEAPNELCMQVPIMQELVSIMGLKHEVCIGFEADDIIATLVAKYSKQINTVIVSSDKDLLQLMSDSVQIYDPMKNIVISADIVREKFGVAPEQMVDYLALVGDSSDNIPGARGIGHKTASSLLTQYTSIHGIYSNLDKIEPQRIRGILQSEYDNIELSRRLVSLFSDTPLIHKLSDYVIGTPNVDQLTTFLERYQFRQLTTKILEKYTITPSISSISTTKQWDASFITEFTKQCLYSGQCAIYIPADDKEIALQIVSDDKNLSISIPHTSLQEAVSYITPILIDNSILKIVHNFSSLTKLLNVPVKINGYDDIMIMSYSIFSKSKTHTLEAMVSAHLNLSSINVHQLLKLHKILLGYVTQYRCNRVYYSLDLPIIEVLLKMEKRGIKVDVEQLEALSAEYKGKLDTIASDIYRLAGMMFNIASPKQIADVLFGKLGLTINGKIPKGTDADILQQLSECGHEIAAKILDWRHYQKLDSTYASALLTQAVAHRVHTTFSIISTSTGRLSSNNPNLQNIPVRNDDGIKLRSVFIAENDHVLLSADYSQIEMRIMADIADVKNLKQAFAENLDIHSITAQSIFGVSLKDVTPELRRRAKAINFGMMYGLTAYGLAKQINVSSAEATIYIDKFFACYPEIRIYVDYIIETCKKNGYVKTIFGRRCFIPDINHSNAAIRNFAYRAAINAPIQGSAADIMKYVMIKLSTQQNIGDLLLQVHDELLFEIHNDILESAKTTIVNVMSTNLGLPFSIPVNIKIGKNWGNGLINATDLGLIDV